MCLSFSCKFCIVKRTSVLFLPVTSTIFSEADYISPFTMYATPSRSMDISRSRVKKKSEWGDCALKLEVCVPCINYPRIEPISVLLTCKTRGGNRANYSLLGSLHETVNVDFT